MTKIADNCFYRATVKAVIRDDAGRVLLIKEVTGDWGLPGGGMEHGEEPIQALARELGEEIGIITITSAVLRKAQPYFSTTNQNWWLWLVYDVTVELPQKLGRELHAEFVDVGTFKGSENKAERRVYAAVEGEV